MEKRKLLAVAPFSATEVSAFGGAAMDVAASGQYAYVGNGRLLTILNIADPAAPVVTSKLRMPDGIRGVAVSGNYAYLACGEAGLQIVNVSNSAAPVIAGAFDDFAISLDVVLQGNYAYVADYFFLDVINITNPAAPTLAGRAQPSSPTSIRLRSVAVSGTTAILGDENYGLRTFSVATPTNPIHRGGYLAPSGVNYGVAFAPQAGYALLGNSTDGMTVLNISSLTAPTKLTAISLGTAKGIQVVGTRAYVASSIWGLQVVELSTISSPSLVTTIGSVVARTNAVSINSGQAWLASESEGLYVTPLNTPNSATMIPAVFSTGAVGASTVVGSRLYQLADSGLEIIDISNPAAPARLGSEGIYNTYDIVVSGNYAYIANGYVGVVVVNVSNPSDPYYVTYYDTPGSATGLALQGQRLYVADGTAGLLILSIASPTNLSFLGSIDTPLSANSVSLSNNLAAVLDGDSIRLIDCTNAASPVSRSTISSTFYTSALLSGTTLYAGSFQVSAYDVSNPANPVFLGQTQAVNSIVGKLAVSGALVFAVTDRGMDILNGRSPASMPVLQSIGGASDAGQISFGLSVAGNYAYLGNNDVGVRVIRIDRPAPTVLSKTYKDDSGQSIEFQFDQDVQASVGGNDLTLFNQTNGQTYSGGLLVLTNGSGGTLARWKPFATNLLPDGRYTASINASAIENSIGTTMSSAVQFSFTVLRGDADRDGTVSFNDLLILAKNYNLTGRTFAQGNFDYSDDGLVGFNDLLILARNYNASVFLEARSLTRSGPRRSALDELA